MNEKSCSEKLDWHVFDGQMKNRTYRKTCLCGRLQIQQNPDDLVVAIDPGPGWNT